jgi:hypothetical protein
MKNILTSIYSAFLVIGKARAASYLARQGNVEGAKAIMLK